MSTFLIIWCETRILKLSKLPSPELRTSLFVEESMFWSMSPERIQGKSFPRLTKRGRCSAYMVLTVLTSFSFIDMTIAHLGKCPFIETWHHSSCRTWESRLRAVISMIQTVQPNLRGKELQQRNETYFPLRGYDTAIQHWFPEINPLTSLQYHN